MGKIDFDLLEKQKTFFHLGKTKSLKFRIQSLKTLYLMIKENENKIFRALKLDLNKSIYEAYMTEVGFCLQEITYAIKNIKKWTKRKRVKTPLSQFPAKSYIYQEPLGVCLIISPWNYPFQLTITPLIGAIAAGNCVTIKPSNSSSHTSRLIKKLINQYFDEDYIGVIEGGREENNFLLNQKYDYIFFTGSVKVGKIVMEAAAKNLIPITLELGGKSPCIIEKDADIELAAKRIAWGKLLNAGQTCVAPDYVLVDKNIKDKLIRYLKKYFSLYNNLPKIINEKHYNRLLKLIANEKVIYGGHGNLKTLQIEPTIVIDVKLDSPIMQEEIFGPILPIIEYENINEVVNIVSSLPKPLALYLFTTSRKCEKYILNSLSYGGGCINDTIVHLASNFLPFGGVGESGFGSYHGKKSFDTFSHYKSIIKKSNKIDINLRYPPFTKNIKILRRFLK